MALLGTLSDNFNDNSRDAAKWNTGSVAVASIVATPPTPAEQNQQLEIVMGANLGNSYNGFVSVATYDLTGSYLAVKVVNATVGGGSIDTILFTTLDANNYYAMTMENGFLFFQKKVSGGASTIANVAYSGATHLWWRIKEASGTVYFHTSSVANPDPTTDTDWTQRATNATSAFAITAVYAELTAGTWQNQIASTTIFDDVNPGGAPPPTTRSSRLALLGVS